MQKNEASITGVGVHGKFHIADSNQRKHKIHRACIFGNNALHSRQREPKECRVHVHVFKNGVAVCRQPLDKMKLLQHVILP